MSAAVEPTVTQADIAAVLDWWQHLLARTRYRNYLTTGAPSEAEAEAALEEMLKRSKLNVNGMTERIMRGQSVADWHNEMALEVKRSTLAAVALARGGVGRIALADVGDDE